MTRHSEELAQVAIHDLVRQTAKTVAEIATLNDRYTSIPNVDEILIAEIAVALTEQHVPADVAADLLGVSRRSFFRKRNAVPKFGTSCISELVSVLSERSLTSVQVLQTLHDFDPKQIALSLRFLQARNVANEVDDKWTLTQSLANDPTSEFRNYLALLATEQLPISVKAFVRNSGEPEVATTALNALEQTGLVTIVDDQIVDVAQLADLSSQKRDQLLPAFMLLTRRFFETARGRLRHGQRRGRIRLWSFSATSSERIQKLIQDFADRSDLLWEESEPKNRDDSEVEHLFLGWHKPQI